MRNFVLLPVLSLFFFCSGCSSMQAFERRSETKMIVILEKLEYGVKTGAIPPEYSQHYHKVLQSLQTEYAGMNGKDIPQQERAQLEERLSVLENNIKSSMFRIEEPKDFDIDKIERYTRAYGVPPQTFKRIKETTRGERIGKLQSRIDNGRSSGVFSLYQADEFQFRLDYIRGFYMHILGRVTPHALEEKEVISHLLDSLEQDLNHIQQL